MRRRLGLGRIALWQLYLGAGALLCALYVWVPPFAGSGPVINLLGLSPVVAIVVGHPPLQARRRAGRGACSRSGCPLFWLGDLYTYSYPRLFDADVPFPSLGDGVYLAVYPALMAGLLLLVRRRNPERDRAGVIDSLIMTLGLALLSWVALIAPYLHDDTMSVTAQARLDRLPARRHPAAGRRDPPRRRQRQAPAGVLPAGARASSRCWSPTSSTACVTLNGAYHGQVILDVGWISFYLLWGAAALHPSMRELEQPAPDREPRLTPLRLALLTVRLADRAGRSS